LVSLGLPCLPCLPPPTTTNQPSRVAIETSHTTHPPFYTKNQTYKNKKTKKQKKQKQAQQNNACNARTKVQKKPSSLQAMQTNSNNKTRNSLQFEQAGVTRFQNEPTIHPATAQPPSFLASPPFFMAVEMGKARKARRGVYVP
jgi:hypothetical protein